MLPAYCRQDVTGIHYTLEERQRWDQILGSGIDSIHHYCRGLNWTNTALFFSKNRQERTDALGYSLQEFDFILNQTDTSHFKLLPEVLTKKGENLIRLRRFPEALPVLQKAIQVKPDYWPPYAVLSDYFRDVGDIPKAHEWLDKALAIDPNAKSLKVRQTELAQAKVKAPSASVQKTAKQTDKAAEPEKSASPKPAAEAKPAAK